MDNLSASDTFIVHSTYDESYRALVAQLKAARRRLNLTQTEAGKLVCKSRCWLSKVEACEIKLDVLYFARLCKALGIKTGRLIRQLEQGLC